MCELAAPMGRSAHETLPLCLGLRSFPPPGGSGLVLPEIKLVSLVAWPSDPCTERKCRHAPPG
jgi:hypothetical protein